MSNLRLEMALLEEIPEKGYNLRLKEPFVYCGSLYDLKPGEMLTIPKDTNLALLKKVPVLYQQVDLKEREGVKEAYLNNSGLGDAFIFAPGTRIQRFVENKEETSIAFNMKVASRILEEDGAMITVVKENSIWKIFEA